MAEPFFFEEAQWIPVPSDFSLNIVQGKGYDSEDGLNGKALWGAVIERLAAPATANSDPGPATIAAVESARYGEPVLVQPRLGQGIFRAIVTDAYERRCAITGERTPTSGKQAAHVEPDGAPQDGTHSGEPEGPFLVCAGLAGKENGLAAIDLVTPKSQTSHRDQSC